MKNLSLALLADFVRKEKIELKSTHGRLCFPVIERIYKKMVFGIRFAGIKVDGDVIIDGHHRYLASLLAGVTLDRFPSNRTSATSVVELFDSNDWDTEAKIKMLNEADAQYNNLDIEELNKLLQ